MTSKMITKGVTSVSVEFAFDGAFVDYSGQNSEGDYVHTRRVFLDIEEALDHVHQVYKEANDYRA